MPYSDGRLFRWRTCRTASGTEVYRDERGVHADDVWDDPVPPLRQAKERIGYPTQKPLALLNRIVQASSSNPGDM